MSHHIHTGGDDGLLIHQLYLQNISHSKTLEVHPSLHHPPWTDLLKPECSHGSLEASLAMLRASVCSFSVPTWNARFLFFACPNPSCPFSSKPSSSPLQGSLSLLPQWAGPPLILSSQGLLAWSVPGHPEPSPPVSCPQTQTPTFPGLLVLSGSWDSSWPVSCGQR